METQVLPMTRARRFTFKLDAASELTIINFVSKISKEFQPVDMQPG